MEKSRGRFRHDAESGNSTQALSSEPHFPSPIFRQVLPARIHFLDQRNLLFTTPALHLLFATNSDLHILVAFVIHEPVNLVLLSESFNRIVFMLVKYAVRKSR